EVPTLVPEPFITASGGSPSNPQLCWGLLASIAMKRSCEQTGTTASTAVRKDPFARLRNAAGGVAGPASSAHHRAIGRVGPLRDHDVRSTKSSVPWRNRFGSLTSFLGDRRQRASVPSCVI